MPDKNSTICHFVEGNEGHPLGILEKSAKGGYGPAQPVLLVHGATLGASLFDLDLPDYSLMSELRRSRRPIYALDIRGYGHSLNSGVMDEPPGNNLPFARLTDAMQDVASAVRFVLDMTFSKQLDLVGFSWGSVVVATFATLHPRHIRRLVLYAPLFGESNELWRTSIGDLQDRTRLAPGIGAYRLITRDDIRKRWDTDIGSDTPDLLRDPDLPDVVFDTFARLDPLASQRNPAAFRSPAGALADLIHIFNGQSLYQPARLTMPTLLIRGADDTTSTDSDAKSLLSGIAAPYKDYQVVTPGSHFLCVEKNRLDLYARIDSFLERVIN